MIITDNANIATSADPNQSALINKPKRRMARHPNGEAAAAAAVPANAESNAASFEPAKAPRITKSAAVTRTSARTRSGPTAAALTDRKSVV